MSPYCIGKLNDPPSFSDYVDEESKHLLERRFLIDLVWSIIGGIPAEEGGNEELPLVGSWTHFNKQLSGVEVQKA